MQSKKIGVFLLFLLTAIFFAEFVSAADSCFVGTRTECSGSGGYVIIGLSDTSNAHGQKYTESDYPYVLCCNFGNGIQSIECTSGTQIVKLSAITNAHAQLSSQSGYANTVCYQSAGFLCQAASGNCPSGYNPILSLSSATNAHLGAYGVYNQKICCNVNNTLPPAGTPYGHFSLTSGGPQTSSATKQVGEILYMVAGNLGPYEGQHVSLELWEDDGWFGDEQIRTFDQVVAGGSISVPWTITQADLADMEENSPYEPYFRIKYSGNVIATSNSIDLTITVPVPASAHWSLTSGGPQTSSATKQVGETLYMNGISLGVASGTTLIIELWDDDGWVGDDPVNEFSTVYNGGNISVSWTITQADLNDMDENSPYEPYFRIYSGTSLIVTSNTLDLTITPINPPATPDAYWSSTSGGAEIPNYEVALGETILYMNIANSGLSDGTTTFQVYEDDSLFDDSIRTTSGGNAVIGNVSGGVATAVITLHQSDWDIGDDGGSDSDYQNYYFTVGSITSPNLNVTISGAQIEECLITSFCSDYVTQPNCEQDVCNVGNASVPSAIDCSAENVSCGCWWDTTASSCSPKYTIIDGEGSEEICNINQDIADDCADGFLSFGWLGTWLGPSQNPLEEAKCEDGGVDTIACPAQIQLPFFGVYNIIVIIALALIAYLILSRSKAKKKVAAKRKR